MPCYITELTVGAWDSFVYAVRAETRQEAAKKIYEKAKGWPSCPSLSEIEESLDEIGDDVSDYYTGD